jgi:Tol biopolymer transport system component
MAMPGLSAQADDQLLITNYQRAVFTQLTTSGCCVQPFFSPDGRRVLYLDKPAADKPVGLWAIATDKSLSQPELFTERLGPFSRDLSLALDLQNGRTVVERLSDGARWTINNGGRSVSFSPDATRIAWTVQQESGGFDARRSDIYVANVDGSGMKRVLTRFGGGTLGWLPDSKHILVGGKANRADETAMLGVLDLDAGQVRDLVPVERLRSALLSPDGKKLVYYVAQARDGSQNGMYLLDLTQTSPIPQRLNFFGAFRWRDGNRLLYIPLQPGAPSNELWQLDATTGKAEQIIAASAGSPFKITNGDWDVSRDGAKLLFLSARDRNIWLASLP